MKHQLHGVISISDSIYCNAVFVLSTALPAKSDSDVVLCLQLLSNTLTFTLHLSFRESIDYLFIIPILWIGLIHK